MGNGLKAAGPYKAGSGWFKFRAYVHVYIIYIYIYIYASTSVCMYKLMHGWMHGWMDKRRFAGLAYGTVGLGLF